MAAYAILESGITVPGKNRSVFLPLLLLIAVVYLALTVWSRLGVDPLIAAARDDNAELRALAPSDDAYALQQKKLLSDLAKLAAYGAPFLLADLLLAFALQALVFYAALAAIHGAAGEITLRSVLERAGSTIWSPFLTKILVYIFQLGILLALGALTFIFLVSGPSPFVLVVVLGLLFALVCVFIYLDLVFIVAVIVSVDHPDIRGFAAVKQAWGLVGSNRNSGTGLGVFLFFTVVSFLLAFFFRPGRNAGVAESVVLGILYPLLTAWVKVASSTAFTSYYKFCVDRASAAGVANGPAAAAPPPPPACA